MTKIPVMLAQEYRKGMSGNRKDTSKYKDPPQGWIASEKFDGYRALFKYDENGNGHFYSRAGKIFNCAEWFRESMPPQKILKNKIIDGELWAGRENFQLMGIVRKKKPLDEEWMDITYQVYDIITFEDDQFIDRLKILKKLASFTDKRWKIITKDGTIPYPMNNLQSPVQMTEQKQITSYEMLDKYYKKIINEGGEGVMLKHPQKSYIDGRNSYLLKVKPSFDREAEIIGYKKGNGKYKGKLGGLICRPLKNNDTYMTRDKDENHIFTLSGMDDSIRENYKETHPLGTIITYECSGFTDKGVPRFGRYLRKRDDIILKEEEDLISNEKLKKIISLFTSLEKHYRENQDTFRAKSYSNGLKSLKTLVNDSQLNEKTFSTMKGIGKGLQEKIRQIIDTGTCLDYEKIKDNNSPKSLFLQIHGVGPQCANKMINGGLKTIEDVEKNKDIYLNDVQKKGLRWFYDIQKRIPYKEIQKHEIFLKKILQEIDPNAELTIAGSYRREKPDSGDIDLLIKADSRKVYDEYIDLLIEKDYLQDTLARGNKKFMGMGSIDIGKKKKKCRRIDIMYTKPGEYPFAVLYFTGSGDFNQRMRNELLEKGYTMNEYCVKYKDTKKKIDHQFTTEKDIFDYFGYEYLEPKNRIE